LLRHQVEFGKLRGNSYRMVRTHFGREQEIRSREILSVSGIGIIVRILDELLGEPPRLFQQTRHGLGRHIGRRHAIACQSGLGDENLFR
jgi:hypothetical protein